MTGGMRNGWWLGYREYLGTSDMLASKMQHVSGWPGPSPRVGDMYLLLPVPSTIPSWPYSAALSHSLPGVWSLCRCHMAQEPASTLLDCPAGHLVPSLQPIRSASGSLPCTSGQDKAHTPACGSQVSGALSSSSLAAVLSTHPLSPD